MRIAHVLNRPRRSRARRKSTRRIAVGAVVAALAATVLGATPSGAHHWDAPRAPEEMEQLHFMLGTWDCDVSIEIPGQEPVNSRIHGRGYLTKRGHWLNWDSTEYPGPQSDDAFGRWTFGWNENQQQFRNFFYDNHSNYGTQTSPGGWEDGELLFTGHMVDGSIGAIPYRDHFRNPDRNHFSYNWDIQVNGQWIPAGVSDCERDRGARAPRVDHPEPPEQLDQLEFMHGRWRCHVTNNLPEGTTELDVASVIRPLPELGGHWMQWSSVQLPGGASEGIISTGVFGWNEAEDRFVLFYSDDHSNYGIEFAPTITDDGHIVFDGSIVHSDPSVGEIIYRDDFSQVSEDQFVDVFSAQLDGQWLPIGLFDCRRR